MAHSFAQSTTINCPNCKQEYDIILWMIIDANERPDLIDKIKDGSLHTATCPHCGKEISFDLPLLLFFADREPHLVFSLQERTTREQDEQALAQLLSILSRNLGKIWQENFLESFAPLPYHTLPVFLEQGLDAAKDMFIDGEEELREIVQLIQDWVETKTWDESYKFLQEHPQLLSEKTSLVITDIIKKAHQDNNINFEKNLQRHLEILKQSKALGIDAAYAPLFAAQNPSYSANSNISQLISEVNELNGEYKRSSDLNLLNWLIIKLQQLLQHAELTPEQRPAILFNLGLYLDERYKRLGSLADLERALDVYQQAVALTPADNPDRPMYLNNWGIALCERYERLGSLDDLDAALDLFQQAVVLTPEDSPDRPRYLSNWGNGLRDRSSRLGSLADLERALDVYQQAVALTPADNPDRPGYLNNWGNALSDRFKRLGSLADLEKALELYQQAVDLTPADSPKRPMYLNNWGNALSDRFKRLGSLADLEKALEVHQQAVALTPEGSPDRPMYLNNWGIALCERYERLGSLDDLDAALDLFQQAVALTSEDSPKRPMYLNNWGNALSDRYARLGSLVDLERALEVHQQAVDLTPEGSPDRPGYLSNWGNAIRERYARLGSLADLEKALEVYQQAVALTPEDNPDRPMYLNNLGNALSDRFKRLCSLADLEEALEVYQQAMALTPEGSPERPMYLNNWGEALRVRFERLGSLADLEKALELHQQAVALIPEDSPERPRRLNNWGNALYQRYGRLGSLADLERALELYKQAVELTPQNHPQQITISENLGNAYYQAHEYQHARQAYGDMAATLEELRAASTLKADRQKMLEDYASAFSRLVTCCLWDGDVEAAFRYAEAGKSRALVDALQAEKVDLSAAAAQDPSLQAKLDQAQQLRSQIDYLLERLSQSLGAEEDADARQVLLQARQEWQTQLNANLASEQALWDQIEHDYPAFAITVAPAPFSLAEAHDLAAEENATLVSYYRHAQGWVVYVVTAQDFQLVELNGVDDLLARGLRYIDNLHNRYACTSQAMYALLEDMHARLIAPLRAYLPPEGSRLILSPYGQLHLLPLGAAREADSRRYLSEQYRLRILPSCGTLRAMRLEAAKHQGRDALTHELLAVAYPGAEDPQDPLYLHGVVQETKRIVPLFKDNLCLVGTEATPQAVLQEASSSKLIHFGCHGWFDAAMPETSGLKLYGGWLTAREVRTRMNLAATQLVTLGACLSGKQQVSRGDELTGLITSFVAARARSVIGTLWSVSDEATTVLMVNFYQNVQAGLPLDEALTQAQETVRSNPAWSHPYYWAAFFLTGIV